MTTMALVPHKATAIETRSPHNRILIALLCWFFGVFGVHRFVVGKWPTGLLLLFTAGGFGVWWIVDFIMILLGRFKDDQGRVLGPPQLTYEPVRALPKPKPIPKPLPAPVLEPEFDDPLIDDPLEEKFAELEKEFGEK